MTNAAVSAGVQVQALAEELRRLPPREARLIRPLSKRNCINDLKSGRRPGVSRAGCRTMAVSIAPTLFWLHRRASRFTSNRGLVRDGLVAYRNAGRLRAVAEYDGYTFRDKQCRNRRCPHGWAYPRCGADQFGWEPGRTSISAPRSCTTAICVNRIELD
jgi:hypothetical protein